MEFYRADLFQCYVVNLIISVSRWETDRVKQSYYAILPFTLYIPQPSCSKAKTLPSG